MKTEKKQGTKNAQAVIVNGKEFDFQAVMPLFSLVNEDEAVKKATAALNQAKIDCVKSTPVLNKITMKLVRQACLDIARNSAAVKAGKPLEEEVDYIESFAIIDNAPYNYDLKKNVLIDTEARFRSFRGALLKEYRSRTGIVVKKTSDGTIDKAVNVVRQLLSLDFDQEKAISIVAEKLELSPKQEKFIKLKFAAK